MKPRLPRKPANLNRLRLHDGSLRLKSKPVDARKCTFCHVTSIRKIAAAVKPITNSAECTMLLPKGRSNRTRATANRNAARPQAATTAWVAETGRVVPVATVAGFFRSRDARVAFTLLFSRFSFVDVGQPGADAQ